MVLIMFNAKMKSESTFTVVKNTMKCVPLISVGKNNFNSFRRSFLVFAGLCAGLG